MGLDVMYSKLQSATAVNGLVGGFRDTPRPNRALMAERSERYRRPIQDNWSFRFRVHRDFYP